MSAFEDSFGHTLRAHGAYASFRGDCSLQTGLMGIAVNLIRDRLRNRRLQFWNKKRSAPLPAERVLVNCSGQANDSPESQALLKQQVEAVWTAAGLLSARQKTVFLLRFVEDMDILNCSCPAVIAVENGSTAPRAGSRWKSSGRRCGLFAARCGTGAG